MCQIHRRFSDEQIIEKTRFFALLKSYRQNPRAFSIGYNRITPVRLSAEAEREIQKALLREKLIIQDPNLPISDYNYTALRDRLKNKGIEVSVTTIIDRAKKLNCYRARKKRKFHDREVLTASIGALVQHDGSSPPMVAFGRGEMDHDHFH